MVHGGWPFIRETHGAADEAQCLARFLAAVLLLPPATLADSLREWLEIVPEKVMFGTDAYPYSNELGWEEAGWVAARTGRRGARHRAYCHDPRRRDHALRVPRSSPAWCCATMRKRCTASEDLWEHTPTCGTIHR